MSRALRVTIGVLAGLGLLVLASSYFVSETLNDWFERDLSGRAELALAGAREKLAADWSGTSSTRMRALLTAVAHDERLLAVAACGKDGSLLATTSDWPTEVPCTSVARRVRPASRCAGVGVDALAFGGRDRRRPRAPERAAAHRRGAAARLRDAAARLRFRRAERVPDSAAARRHLRRAGAGRLGADGRHPPGVLAGLDERAAARAARRAAEARVPAADERRARAHRPHQRRARAGRQRRRLDAGAAEGLAAQSPLRRARRRRWRTASRTSTSAATTARSTCGTRPAAWSRRSSRSCAPARAPGSRTAAASADRETVDAHGSRRRAARARPSYTLRRVWLTPEEEQGYYYGFANEGLWPLCHIAHTRPIFRASDWEQYRAVNQRFADAVVRGSATPTTRSSWCRTTTSRCCRG